MVLRATSCDINGRIVTTNHASVSAFDRSYLFGDAIYEVLTVYRGGFIDLDWHVERLMRSLEETGIPAPMSIDVIKGRVRHLFRVNGVDHGYAYLQVSRGLSRPRRHDQTQGGSRLTIMVDRMAWHKDVDLDADLQRMQVDVVTLPDQRWKRCDIKTTSLIANILAKQDSQRQQVQDAILIDAQGFVTESTSSNVWIVSKEGELCTTPLSNEILWGVTRRRCCAMAQEAGYRLNERRIHQDELLTAREVFFSSAIRFITPVRTINGRKVGKGEIGATARSLYQSYRTFASQCVLTHPLRRPQRYIQSKVRSRLERNPDHAERRSDVPISRADKLSHLRVAGKVVAGKVLEREGGSR